MSLGSEAHNSEYLGRFYSDAPPRTRARCGGQPSRQDGRRGPFRPSPLSRTGWSGSAVLSQRRAFPRVCRPAVRGGAQFYRRALFYRGNFGRAGQRRASPRARGRAYCLAHGGFRARPRLQHCP